MVMLFCKQRNLVFYRPFVFSISINSAQADNGNHIISVGSYLNIHVSALCGMVFVVVKVEGLHF